LIPQTANHTATETDNEPLTFDALFKRYSRYVAGVATRLLGQSDHEVDDIVQEVFWLASRHLDKIHDMQAARPWLVTVTVRTTQRKLGRRRWRRMFQGELPASDVPATGATPAERAFLSQIYRVLDKLAPEQRIAWLLRHVEGQKLEDIASSCDCSLATANRRITAVQEVLEEVLRDG
jgi:RNA polymerase sigma-70 factor, ECF subfamily